MFFLNLSISGVDKYKTQLNVFYSKKEEVKN